MFAQHLKTQGPIEVDIVDDAKDTQQAGRNVLWRIEVDSILVGDQWMAHVRAFRDRPRSFLWSGRLQLPFDLSQICDGCEVADFVGRAVSSIRVGDHTATGVYPNLLAAAQKIFLGSRAELELADRIFAGIEAEDTWGTTKAWRAYIGLTRILEHGARPMRVQKKLYVE